MTFVLQAVLFVAISDSVTAGPPRALRRARKEIVHVSDSWVQAPDQQLEATEERFDTQRLDFDVFNRTFAMEAGLQPTAGDVYPLVTYTSFRDGSYTFEDWPVREPPIPVEEGKQNECAAGGPVLVCVRSEAAYRYARDRQRHVYSRFSDLALPPVCATILHTIGVRGLSDDDVNSLNTEQAETGDIALLDVEDDVSEGTSRGLLEKAVEHYHSALYIAIADVDTFFHPWHLVEQLGRLPNQELLYGADVDAFSRHNLVGSTVARADLVAVPHSGGGHLVPQFFVFSRDLLTCSVSTADPASNGPTDVMSTSLPLLASCNHFFATDTYRLFGHESRQSNQNRLWQRLGFSATPVAIHSLHQDQFWDEVSKWLCNVDDVCGPGDE